MKNRFIKIDNIYINLKNDILIYCVHNISMILMYIIK